MIPKKQDIVISDRTEGMVESSASYYQESQLFLYHKCKSQGVRPGK